MPKYDRRNLLRSATLGAAGAAAAASTFPMPALAQERFDWRFVAFWPKGLPGVTEELESFCRRLEQASDGRLRVTYYGGNELVPPFETMDAVQSGTAEMGHGAPYYWKGKVLASQLIASVPFGMTTAETNAWFQYGGGQEIADEVYAEMNCKFFPGGNTGIQMGGWYNKEINTLDDLKSLKIRIPGLGGEVLQKIGSTVVTVPGAETLTSLQTGAIDAAEWVGPFNDLAAGLYRAAKYYYYPGWHEPTNVLDLFINLDAWNKLPDDLKALVELAAGWLNQTMLNGYLARNDQALETLMNEHQVTLKRFPDEVLVALGQATAEVLQGIAAQDPLSRKVLENMLPFRKRASAWTDLNEAAFLQARGLALGDFTL